MPRRGNSQVTFVEPSEGGRPQVDVLMATFNGRRWIAPQVDSILDQRGVDVQLTVSDDGSSDGTIQYLRARSEQDSRIVILPPRQGPRSVTANFLHLFTEHAATDGVFVAFSDQDDVWEPDKLQRQTELLAETGADAVSSNVVSFGPGRDARLIVKNEPQQRWDYLFEAAGPGSTYVFTPAMHARLVVALHSVDTASVGVHDWLLYALVRALGGTWVIDDTPLVAYRQHGDNVQGEHRGALAFLQRLTALRSGFYREQFIVTADFVRAVGAGAHDANWRHDLDALISDLRSTNVSARLRIVRRHRQLRRNSAEGWALAVACLLGIW